VVKAVVAFLVAWRSLRLGEEHGWVDAEGGGNAADRRDGGCATRCFDPLDRAATDAGPAGELTLAVTRG
jgi:hypothetical protein